MSEEKTAEDTYHVFFCYNHEDEPSVKKIGNQLKERKITPWLYCWDIRPGSLRQREIWQQIEHTQAAAVFIGKASPNRQQELEISALLSQFVVRDCPVIPVLLEDAPDEPKISPFLDNIEKTDFRVLKKNSELAPEEEPLNRLIWGITGKRERKSRHVLIASLGESPIVVSSMYDLLTKKEGLTIDQVIVLHPQGEDIEHGYDLVKKALIDQCNNVRKVTLPFDDASSWRNACIYLKELYMLLDICKLRGDTVYLSLAGGRKSMAALMAWIVPFFSCIQKLYHVIDPDDEHFLSIQDLELGLTPSKREAAMHPDLEKLILVNIPFGPGQQIDQERISRLFSASEDELEQMQYEEAEQASFIQAIVHEGTILEARLTERVMQQFQTLCLQDRDAAPRVRAFLERMQYTTELRNLQTDSLNL